MMDVGSWLRGLGLRPYEAAFRENAIDDTVLPNLTAEDLKDLGVGIVGHRRKLLDAIAALRADASAKAPPLDALPATDITAEDHAERRQVTVMFSDLVGSTALSARMDPEDLREVISAYQKCVAEAVQRFGIATGLVVVGDLIGSGASQEQAIVGETPNLAARLQGIAEPNSVVIAESTRKLVGDLFDFHDLGA